MTNLRRSAFTLIELLVVIAIIAVIGVVTYLNLQGGNQSVDVSTTAQQMIALANEAQSRAQSQYQNVVWGIHFANSTNTAPFFALFKGLSYSTATTQGYYRLPATVSYATSTVPSGSSVDVTFSQVSGHPSSSATITIVSTQNSSILENVLINSVGLVTYDNCTQNNNGCLAWSIQPAWGSLDFGSALGSFQLAATDNVPGTFVYNPPAGTVLLPGANQMLSVTFTPSVATNFATATATALVTINAATGTPQIIATEVFSRDPNTGNIVVLMTLANAGGSLVTNVLLNTAKIGATNPITALPVSSGAIASGNLATDTLQFPGSIGTPGTMTTFTLAGTFSPNSGNFAGSGRIQLP